MNVLLAWNNIKWIVVFYLELQYDKPYCKPTQVNKYRKY